MQYLAFMQSGMEQHAACKTAYRPYRKSGCPAGDKEGRHDRDNDDQHEDKYREDNEPFGIAGRSSRTRAAWIFWFNHLGVAQILQKIGRVLFSAQQLALSQ